MTCVPLLLWTAFVLFTNSPPLLPTLSHNIVFEYLPPNLALFVALAYCTLYVLLEPVAGSVLSLIILASTSYANRLTSTYGTTANYWAASVHVVSWLAQFVGHGVFEGRAPALLDNIFQALFLAPLFVWLEFLFLLGYRPELKSRLDKMVEQDVKTFRESKVNGKVNGNTVGNGHAKSG